MEPYIGEIRLFGGNYVPQNKGNGTWQACDGSLMSVNDWQGLFHIIGTTYGGDGISTFAVPDLRGRIPIGCGQGPGLSLYTLAQQGGAESVAITSSTLPAHQHTLQATTNSADTTDPSNALLAATLGSQQSGLLAYLPPSEVTKAAPLDASTIDMTGGGEAHSNIMPSQGMTYIICLQGLYPEPNQ